MFSLLTLFPLIIAGGLEDHLLYPQLYRPGRGWPRSLGACRDAEFLAGMLCSASPQPGPQDACAVSHLCARPLLTPLHPAPFLLLCTLQCFLELLEQFTHFATVATAITGKGFIPAAKDLFDMLKRNFLATYSLWWIPDFTLVGQGGEGVPRCVVDP